MIWPTAILIVELVVLFIAVSFLIEIAQRKMGPDRLRTWMGGPPVIAALKGITVGFVTPFCTFSAIPLLVGLRRAGVPPAGYVAFISAAPVLDPILFGALVLIVGLKVAVVYSVVTFAAALGLALIAEHVGLERHLKPDDAIVPIPVGGSPQQPVGTSAGDPAGSCGGSPTEPWQGWRTEGRLAFGASGRLLKSFGPALLLGVAIGVAIEAAVSPAAAARVTTGNLLVAIPAAAAIGTPLYFNTELFVPIANSLHNAGVGVGAIVSLTIAGAGASIPEFILLSKLAKPAALSVLISFVFAVAIAGGLLAHAVGT